MLGVVRGRKTIGSLRSRMGHLSDLRQSRLESAVLRHVLGGCCYLRIELTHVTLRPGASWQPRFLPSREACGAHHRHDLVLADVGHAVPDIWERVHKIRGGS